MGEFMLMPHIKSQFEDEWILIQDPQTSDNLEVQGGKVLWHSKDRDEVYRKAMELRPRHSAILYTGKIPDGVVIIL
jgi:hypothetical protein